ncbi:NPCBM/NEW2 domain-containing protein [Clostridium aciditolerans]|uniref:Alpha-galactosidase n=1 Tax=Clostridium aciditolerans TaxID=339861 RepID=A0A934HWH4_9CLOT|nr:NPCBM/NEW2 domain-containing protein [Clostridium aciditolerans]MBI6874578.1 NPCBM/NEW2 domain-containing protein [Clostridium aciditolerans]
MRRFKVFLLVIVFTFAQFISTGVMSKTVIAASPLNDGLAPTPPMGWNSWNKFGGDIDQWKIMHMADAMVENGMKDAGYEYINIDDNWMAKTRDQNGDFVPDPTRFPDGIKAVADYVHSKGLKLGIYSSNGARTCMGLPGSQGYEDKDAKKFAEWGVDYLKYDFCFNARSSTYAPDIDKIVLSDGINRTTYEAESSNNTLTGNAILVGSKVGYIGNNSGELIFNKITVPAAGDYTLTVYYYNGDPSRNLFVSVNGGTGEKYSIPSSSGWGTVADYAIKVTLKQGENIIKFYNPEDGATISAQQYGVMRDALKATGRPIVFSICEWGANKPWLWGPSVGHLWRTTGDIVDSWDSMTSIMDQNSVLAQYAGPGHWNDPDMLEVGNGGMTDTEYRAHFSLWSMMAAPLIAGNDITNMSDSTKEILLNKEIIAIDQDRLGIQGSKIRDDGDYEVWVKPLANGDKALLFFNRSQASKTMSLDIKDLGLKKAPAYIVRDLWAHSESAAKNQISAVVPSHGVAMFRVRPGTPDMAQPATDFTITYDNDVVAGQKSKVTVKFTNNGRTAIEKVAINLQCPEGWDVNAASATTFNNLPPGRSITTAWDITVPGDANLSLYDIVAKGTFLYGDQQLQGQKQLKSQIKVLPVPPSMDSYLSDIHWLESTNGWGPVEKDMSNGGSASGDGKIITINGTTYEKGLGTHAESAISYYIGGKFSKFIADVGIDDEVGNNGSVAFQVWADDKKIYDSEVLYGSSPVKHVDVDINGAKILKLVVTNGGDNIDYDHADWAGAKIIYNTSK